MFSRWNMENKQIKENSMAVESFEVSATNEFGDLLNKNAKKERLTVGVYTSAYFEYYRMYPQTLQGFVESDVKNVLGHIRGTLDQETDIIWPGIVTTMDEADRAGRVFKEKAIDMLVFIMFTYTVDAISLQCLKYVSGTPFVIILRQSHRNIDFTADYEQTLRNSAMISASQLTGAFKKMGRYENYEVLIGTDDDEDLYASLKRYTKALKTYLELQETSIGLIGHVFRGMYDHEFDRTTIAGRLGPQVIDIQISHFLDLWEKVTEEEVDSFISEVGWIRNYPMTDVSEEHFYKECRFSVAYRKLIEKFHLDAVCYLGQHFVEHKTGCTGYLANIVFGKAKKIMTNTEGDVNGLIMMYIMNRLTGQTPLFGEWGEFGIAENSMQIMMHGYADLDLAKDPSYVKITGTPENWGFADSGFSVEFTSKPGPVTIGHFINDQDHGWRMLISHAESLDVAKSIPCKDVTMVMKTERPIKDYIMDILKRGFDHHAIICYGDVTWELSLIADFMKIQKDVI